MPECFYYSPLLERLHADKPDTNKQTMKQAGMGDEVTASTIIVCPHV